MRLRLQKYIAQSGICSRRAAEILIKDGKVLLNSSKLAQIGDSVDPNVDVVSVDGQVLRPKTKQYYIFNKPTKLLCSKKDSAGLLCLYNQLLPSMRHLNYAGRLDYMSEGLLILSNDGNFVNRLTHPSFNIQKRYQVSIKSIVDIDLFLKTITNEGIKDDGEILKADSATIISSKKGIYFLELTLHEGKNREIRRMINAFNGKVIRLIRVQMGPFLLNDLKPGKWRAFNQRELKFVKEISETSVAS